MTETVTYSTNAQTILSLCATTSDKVKDVSIKNGQLLFIHDVGRIALDLHGKRTFYNQIIELDADQDRENLTDAINGKYYFIIETAVLWRYFNGWIQLTSTPEEILFIGTELPELGQAKKFYVNTTEGNENISIWDEDSSEYRIVANKTQTMSADEIIALFNN